jgi:hypothetical protein
MTRAVVPASSQAKQEKLRMRIQTGFLQVAAASVVVLLGVFAPSSGRANTITQTVTLLDPNSLHGYTTGSTSFSQFDPTLGALNAVTFAIAGATTDYPYMSIGTSFGNYSGAAGTQDYQANTPSGLLIIYKSVYLSNNSGTGAYTNLQATSDPTLGPYIGTGALTLSALYARSAGESLSLSDFGTSNQGRPGPSLAPLIAITYDYTVAATPLPAALPLFASGLGALGLLGWRRKRKAKLAA